jgi:signal transduction histidine kinase
MRRNAVAAIRFWLWISSGVLAFGLSATVTAAPTGLPPPEQLTNLFQLRHWAGQQLSVIHPFRVEADVLAVDPAVRVLALRDATGMEIIRFDRLNPAIEPGSKVRWEGSGSVIRRKGAGLVVVPRWVVDNDGIHGARSRSATVSLRAGLNPITLQWFNRGGNSILNVEYEGPGLPRQNVTSSVLLRDVRQSGGRTTNVSNGLHYRCYEGSWDVLPDFTLLRPVKTGTAAGFDLDLRSRKESVGMEFDGFIRLPQDGVYMFHVTSDDGSRLLLGEPSSGFQFLTNDSPSLANGKAPSSIPGRGSNSWLTLEGIVTSAGMRGDGGELHLRVGADQIRVEVFENGGVIPDFSHHSRVQVSGIYQDLITEDGLNVPGVLLTPSWKAVRRIPTSEARPGQTRDDAAVTILRRSDRAGSDATTPEVITAVEEIKALAPEMASQYLPVLIRGVVTAVIPARGGAVLQDSTRGIFVNLLDVSGSEPILEGEFCEVEGVTGPGMFAPLINARQVVRLGAGRFPQPLRATWKQLMNGSLDTQYVEIDGVVTVADGHRIVLLTDGGQVSVLLGDFQPNVLAGYENAVIRIRGCVFAPFKEQTRQLDAGPISVAGAMVQVLQPAPNDVFSVPQKSIADFLLYDPDATPFRLVKVSGQVSYSRGGEFFLINGTNGMHVSTRKSDRHAVGELVDAVGFVDLGGVIPALKEAMVRKNGADALPPSTRVRPEDLLRSSLGGTLVQVDATLMNHWLDRSEYVLELQSGFLAFKARINSRGRSLPLPPLGSRLEITGVYGPEGSYGGRTVSGFELLMHSPMDIRVLSKPPWWTPRRVLILAATLGALLCGALVWNKELRRQVQERTRKLELEIRSRERAEQQHAAEAERARIARDLHDDLGTGLTEVSLLASAGLGEFDRFEKSNDRFRAIAEKARGLVSGLDVIVWAVDPKRNSLQSFADYVGSYVKEFLSASNILCRLKIPIECDPVVLPGAVRHSLFLAIKEALNNIVRHASATEVELQLTRMENNCLRIVISDNGRGFDPDTVQRGDGLGNLRDRLDALNGECQIMSKPGHGTTIQFVAPFQSA